ncbi:ABC-F family ATP-binding cassette domain-containing protein [Salipiger mucosus]|uniref:Putative ABC transporter, ATP-binding protein n=1 Tax=Salipiger mucosus DSM 16094 TaxID=1123237 RepID=S9QGI6_9RHOB|nr:ABC-F family ATP-binding cassette domain-containing protein [Salipiger mucosus]EPX80531.1 putative ABC transporter, ATP-binding protein [Salipiger mucosus DSM 16094]
MPASISLNNLSWSAPDGSPLFTDIDLTFGPERTGIVGRNGIGKSTLLRLISGKLAPTSGHVSASGTWAAMRQEVLEHPGETVADILGVGQALDLLERADRGAATVDDMAEADWTLPVRVEAALARCDLRVDPSTPLATLSGGQRTRAALAALTFAEPDFLLLDEPTNNLDQAGRRSVIEMLRTWPGGAIVVSHDRALLEEMDAIVELTSLGASRYGGNYSAFRAMKEAELAAAEQALAHAGKTHDETARRARQAAERKARKDSVGRKARASGSQPKVLLDYEKGRAEASGGANMRLREARREAADEALAAAREKVEVLTPLRMDIAYTGLPAGKTVLMLDRVSGGYDPGQPVIRDLSLTVAGPERIVLAGPNGSGKTTLLKLITGQLRPMCGEAQVAVRWALLDQHVGFLSSERTLRENFLALHPEASAEEAHAALARFGFRADDARRQAGKLSGGERLRAGLACVLGGPRPPQLLILDEPTNHLDLAGLDALEAALAAYDGAILAVSHDQTFVQSLGPDRVVTLEA